SETNSKDQKNQGPTAVRSVLNIRFFCAWNSFRVSYFEFRALSAFYASLSSFDLQDPVVGAVGDVQVAAGMHVDAVRLIELDFERRRAHAAGAFLSAASNSDNLAVGSRVFADHVIFRIGDDDPAVAID